MQGGGGECESTGTGPGAEHINGRFLYVLCIFVRCKEEEESVSLLGGVQVLSSMSNILMDDPFLYCIFLSDARRRRRV
jgi:hypothetical protein